MKVAFFVLAILVSQTASSFSGKIHTRKQQALASALFSASAAGSGKGGVEVYEKIPAGTTYSDHEWKGFTCKLKHPIYQISSAADSRKPPKTAREDSDDSDDWDSDPPAPVAGDKKDDILSPTCLAGLVWEKDLGAGAFGRVCRLDNPAGCIALGEVRLPTPKGGHTKLAMKIMHVGGLWSSRHSEQEVCVQSYAAEHDIAPHVYGAWYCGGRMYMVMDLLYSSLSDLDPDVQAKPEVHRATMGAYERGLDAGFFQMDSHSGNVAFGLDGKVKLIDFGILQFLPRREWDSEGAKKYTLQYMVAAYTDDQMLKYFGVTWDQYKYGSSRPATLVKVVDVPKGAENKL